MSPQDSEPNQPDDERVVALHRATITAVDFRRARFDKFTLGGCLFDRCDFRGLKLDRRLAPLLVGDGARANQVVEDLVVVASGPAVRRT